MEGYSIKERVFMFKTYYRHGSDVAKTIRIWSDKFKDRPAPTENFVKTLIEQFDKTGDILDK